MKKNLSPVDQNNLLLEAMKGGAALVLLKESPKHLWPDWRKKLADLIIRCGTELNAETVWAQTKDRELVVHYIDLLHFSDIFCSEKLFSNRNRLAPAEVVNGLKNL